MGLDHDACYRALSARDARFDGRFFTAVKTTGIYCRPVCPARTPHSKNVIFYTTAAAARAAGYRPCLRCRPETTPDLGAWRGTSNTVSRALSLIELGALDQGRVEALAERLGVGERQLRRLFREHLGASPILVAQLRRVLRALPLIQQTRLGMTEIAFAAGFASVRRFNEAFVALFQRAPAKLRRLGGGAIALRGDTALSRLLRSQRPRDWPSLLELLRRRATPGLGRVSHARRGNASARHSATVATAAAEGGRKKSGAAGASAS
jgi:AraC family transcriptional regulator of adaptative response / DNA-3-methyladenine glycosylase II